MGNFLLGLGIGITVGVLVAPKSGADTRRIIADKTAEGIDDVMEQGRHLYEQGRQIKNSAQDLIDRGRDTVMSHKQKLTDMVSRVADDARREYQRAYH